MVKVPSATQEHAKSQSQPLSKGSRERLIIKNGDLIEDLTKHEAWSTIIVPLLQERIASVSGRLTNGRYYHGTFTQDWKGETPVMLAGYQKALMDIWNDIQDFVVARDRVLVQKKQDDTEKAQVVVNPFLEELEDEQD